MQPSTLTAIAPAVPVAAALLILLTGDRPAWRDGIAVGASVLLCTVVLALAPAVLDGHWPQLTLVEVMPGLTLSFEVEPLGLLFAAVASFLWIPSAVYSIGYLQANQEHEQTRFHFFFALALAATTGIAFAGNLLTLFVFYEALTLSTYPLVTHAGTPDALRAGRLYLGFLLSTSIGLLLLAIIWTWAAAGTLDFREGGILAGRLGPGGTALLLALYAFGAGKAALMPVHRWLPAAMVAPTPVSALLHAVAVVKAGVFVILKVVVYIFGVSTLAGIASGRWLVLVAGATVLLASLSALKQDNLKRLLAFSTISQLGYVVLATAVLAPLSVLGAALHIAAHAFGKITLFFAAGSIATATHKTEVSQLAGIGRSMPWTMAAFTIGAASMIGIPPTAGFVSKWFMLAGAWQARDTLAIGVIIVSTLLNAAYFLPILYAAFFRAEPPPEVPTGEAPLPLLLALGVTALGTVLLFFLAAYPLALGERLIGQPAS